ncbi:MAG: hypothetical protein ACYTHJ_08645 [Planctomycetota bacterium]
MLTTTPALAADPWADHVVAAHTELDGSGVHDDPQSVLGPPATTFFDTLFGLQYVTSIVSGPFNLDAPAGEPLITTINAGQFIKVEFDEPVCDHVRNPFGIDLLVYGNSFMIGSGAILPDTDLSTISLSGLMFAESVTVAVSESGIGSPVTDPRAWYVFDDGPYGDGLFPTNPFAWDSVTADWGDALDFTLPVDPTLGTADFVQPSVPAAIDLYRCGAGGTGFDLAETPFACIRFVYLTSSGGEVDALADVSPSMADFDRNGNVDLRDIAEFQCCFDGQLNASTTCECRSGDFDDAGGIGLIDYGEMWGLLTGPTG